MRRGAILGLLCAAAAWSQALPLDCGQSQTLTFSAANSRYNLQFSGQAGETVLIRFVLLSVVPTISVSSRRAMRLPARWSSFRSRTRSLNTV